MQDQYSLKAKYRQFQGQEVNRIEETRDELLEGRNEINFVLVV
jgi:hypothetical protein